MSLEIKTGIDVFATNGKKVGAVDRVVIDPLTNDVTHIVVHKGWIFREDKVIAVEMIESADEERIELTADVDAKALPRFEERHFLTLRDRHRASPAPPLTFYGPYAAEAPVFPHAMRTVVERNIPARTVALEEGAMVYTRDGEEGGRFQEVILTDTGQATHIVLETDAATATLKAVPISWIESVEEHELRLGVDHAMIEAVPPFDPADLAA